MTASILFLPAVERSECDRLGTFERGEANANALAAETGSPSDWTYSAVDQFRPTLPKHRPTIRKVSGSRPSRLPRSTPCCSPLRLTAARWPRSCRSSTISRWRMAGTLRARSSSSWRPMAVTYWRRRDMAHPFNPANWLAMFKEAGGSYVLTDERLHLWYMSPKTGPDDLSTVRTLSAELTSEHRATLIEHIRSATLVEG